MEGRGSGNSQLGLNALCNYKIEKKIGKGQFSEVYRAIYLVENKLVALKKVKVSASDFCLTLLHITICLHSF